MALREKTNMSATIMQETAITQMASKSGSKGPTNGIVSKGKSKQGEREQRYCRTRTQWTI